MDAPTTWYDYFVWYHDMTIQTVIKSIQIF